MKPFNLNLTPKFWGVIVAFIVVVVACLFLFIPDCSKLEDDDLPIKEFPSIKIDVVNGCGFTGVGANIRRFLSDKNIDVLSVSNARMFIYDETIIIVKHEDDEDLKRLKDITKINNVIYAINDNYVAPFVIIAGKDYQKYFKINRF